MAEWVSAKCDECGWVAQNMVREKAEGGICPYCGETKLRPL